MIGYFVCSPFIFLNIAHIEIKVETAAVRLSTDARSQIHYMQVQADLFCVYNCCCLYNCNAMQWFEAKMRTGMC